MKTPEQPASSAQETYQRKYTETCDLILNIVSKLEALYNDSQPKNWADVGSLEHINEELAHITEFLGV